jgi:hypothetical protein
LTGVRAKEVDDMPVTQRAETFAEPTAREHPPDCSRGGSRRASTRLPTQHEWRWIPDPTEVDLPTPSTSPDDGTSNALIRALAWANLHYWG